MTTLFDIPTPGLFSQHYLAEVVSVQDPGNLSRVQVRLFHFTQADGQEAEEWARVAVPFAGADRGAFLLPDVGDEVLVVFLHGDPRQPVVVGSFWNGSAGAPESLGGSGDRIDRWTFVGKAGTRIAIVEEKSGQEMISLTTPNGVSLTLTDSNGGKIELRAAGNTITLDTQGLSINSPGAIQANAARPTTVTCSQVTFNSALISAKESVVSASTALATTVTGTTYTPGAGNIW
jgi:uncharacterized protein involved in type VI secretion and phage assembly